MVYLCVIYVSVWVSFHCCFTNWEHILMHMHIAHMCILLYVQKRHRTTRQRFNFIIFKRVCVPWMYWFHRNFLSFLLVFSLQHICIVLAQEERMPPAVSLTFIQGDTTYAKLMPFRRKFEDKKQIFCIGLDDIFIQVYKQKNVRSETSNC